MSDNELIADFMGGVFYGPDDLDHKNKWWFRNQPHEGYRNDAHHLSSGLKYHCDWSWLMPVVEKIEGIGFEFAICQNKALVMNDLKMIHEPITENKLAYDKRFEWESIGTSNSKIECTYQAVVEFIKWYNQHKP